MCGKLFFSLNFAKPIWLKLNNQKSEGINYGAAYSTLNYDTKYSLILKEYSNDNYLEPYYPINNKSNRSTYKRYLNEVSKIKNFIIGGRLADYAYYDMDMTILAALNKFNYILKKYN